MKPNEKISYEEDIEKTYNEDMAKILKRPNYERYHKEKNQGCTAGVH